MLQQGQKRGQAGHPVVADAFRLPLRPCNGRPGLLELHLAVVRTAGRSPAGDQPRAAPGRLADVLDLRPGHPVRTACRATGGGPGRRRQRIQRHAPDRRPACGRRLQDPVLDVERLDASYASVRDLVLELKGIGSSRFDPPAAQPCTRRQWQALADAYPTDGEGRVHATYEVIFGHALAPVSRTDGETATVPVAALGRQTAGKSGRATIGGFSGFSRTWLI